MGAKGGTFGEVSQVLEGEELGGGGGSASEFDGGVEDGLVGGGEFFFVTRGGEEEMDLALAEGLEGGEGEFFVGGELGVDDVEQSDFGVEGAQWLVRGEGEAETFWARFGGAVQDVIVMAVAEPVGELFALGDREGGERGLELWFLIGFGF